MKIIAKILILSSLLSALSLSAFGHGENGNPPAETGEGFSKKTGQEPRCEACEAAAEARRKELHEQQAQEKASDSKSGIAQ